MPDIIRLLPDSVANQIAAGEVVQRPASAVKELLENSIDAGATEIQLIVKDAGKTLIQVIDNGKGMSETDARMAFERHATSKIQSAEDIFAITSRGFRGEALASIAAVAQVDLKSKTEGQDLGTHIHIEASHVTQQDYCNCPQGSQIEIKNLFYNIPARRNFLKSNHVELRHIIDEFERVAIPHPDIHFSFTHNGDDLFDLPKAGLRQRIVNVFGSKFNEKLVPVEEETPILKISGFIAKPEFSKKTRGEQFFFANNRFIKNNYLHRAVVNAFEGLISEDSHPSYFLFLELDPARIDVNIHPTKTEIKFDDEKAVHTIIRTAVKHALGQYNVAPSLDFNTDSQFAMPLPAKGTPIEPPGVLVDTNFNPFNKPSSPRPKPNRQPQQDWEQVMANLPEIETGPQQEVLDIEPIQVQKNYTQIASKYILTAHGEGMIVIHQQRAHERIVFEQLIKSLESKSIPSQQLLFPQNMSFSPSDFILMQALMPKLQEIGFDMDKFGKNEVIINGIPLYLDAAQLEKVLEQLVESEKNHQKDKTDQYEEVAKVVARVSSIKTGHQMNQEEMQHLVDELFACQSPYFSIYGKPIVVNLQLEDLDKSFN